MRRGAIFFIIALAVAALLHGRRKPIEDRGDESAHGDWPHIPFPGAGGAPYLRAQYCRDARTCVPALYSDVEQDGWITVTPVHGVVK